MDKKQVIQGAFHRSPNDSNRMLDILWKVQDSLRSIDSDSISLITEETRTYSLEGAVTFFTFFFADSQCKFIVRICEDIFDSNAGLEGIFRVSQAGNSNARIQP